MRPCLPPPANGEHMNAYLSMGAYVYALHTNRHMKYWRFIDIVKMHKTMENDRGLSKEMPLTAASK